MQDGPLLLRTSESPATLMINEASMLTSASVRRGTQPEDSANEVSVLPRAELAVIDSAWGHVGTCSYHPVDV